MPDGTMSSTTNTPTPLAKKTHSPGRNHPMPWR